MATGEGGWFGATFGALVPGLTKDEAGSAREQPAPNGAWFGWVPAVPGLPWVQFSARGGGPFEPETTTTQDVEDGEWSEDGEEQEEAAEGNGGEEGGEDYDELMDADGREIPYEEVRSIRSARSIREGLRPEPVNDDEETGSAVRDLGEGHPAPLGPFKQRPRSRTEQALPLGIEQAFRRLKEQLWGRDGEHQNAQKGVRKAWNARYADALQDRQRSRKRGTNLLCSTEVFNGLLVPSLCFIFFLLQIFMSTIFSSK